ncbi:MAG: cyclase family protein [Chloroflexi bacterium]|nr:cyclase family protein [Chloroflexota bacterium]
MAVRLRSGRIVDISLQLGDTFQMHTPGGFTRDLQFALEVLKEYDAPGGAGQIVRGAHLRLHAGTHIDAPAHFVKDGLHVHQIPLETLVGEAVVANLSDRAPDSPITAQDLERAVGGTLQRGERLLIRTDWNKHYGEPGWEKGSPYLTPEAVDWCVARGLALVGMDFSHGKDAPGSPSKFYTSRTLCEHNVLVMPYLKNLDQIRKERVTLIVLPLSIAGVESAPVRAVVIEDE